MSTSKFKRKNALGDIMSESICYIFVYWELFLRRIRTKCLYYYIQYKDNTINSAIIPSYYVVQHQCTLNNTKIIIYDDSAHLYLYFLTRFKLEWTTLQTY